MILGRPTHTRTKVLLLLPPGLELGQGLLSIEEGDPVHDVNLGRFGIGKRVSHTFHWFDRRSIIIHSYLPQKENLSQPLGT